MFWYSLEERCSRFGWNEFIKSIKENFKRQLKVSRENSVKLDESQTSGSVQASLQWALDSTFLSLYSADMKNCVTSIFFSRAAVPLSR